MLKLIYGEYHNVLLNGSAMYQYVCKANVARGRAKEGRGTRRCEQPFLDR